MMRLSLQEIPVLRSIAGRLRNDGRPLWRRPLPAPPIEAGIGAPGDLLAKISNHHDLLRRHGAARLLSFYAGTLWRELEKAALDPGLVQARAEIATRAVETAGRYGPAEKASDWGRKGAIALSERPKVKPDAEFIELRRRGRGQLAEALRSAASRAHRKGKKALALELYRQISDLWALKASDLQPLVQLLWEKQDRSPWAISKYLQYLRSAESPNGNPGAASIRKAVRECVAINESVPEALLPHRIAFQHAMASLPGMETDAMRSLGLGYLRLKKPHQALPFLERARGGADPGGVSSFYLGQTLFLLERYEDAGEAFQEALNASFPRTRILAWQALAWAKARNHERAARMFAEAESEIDIKELTSDFYVYWGRSCFLSGEAAEAERRFRTALEINPRDWHGATGLAVSLDALDRRGDARAWLEGWVAESAPNSNPGWPAYLLGRLFELGGENSRAAHFYGQALEAAPDNPHFLQALAILADREGRADAAGLLVKAAKTPLACPEVFRRLALQGLGEEDRNKARRWLMRLLEASGGIDAVQALLDRDLVSQAVECFNAGRYGQSAKLLDSIALDLREDAEVKSRLALALACDARLMLREGKTEEGVWGQIKRAASIAWIPEIRFLAALGQALRGEVGEGVKGLEALAQEQPGVKEYGFFAAICRHFTGAPQPGETIEALSDHQAGFAAPELLSSIFMLQSLKHVRKGSFAEAAKDLQNWAKNPVLIQTVPVIREQVNLFAAFCLCLGSRRLSGVPKSLDQLASLCPPGYWDIAGVLVQHHLAAARGPQNADAREKVEDCHKTYQRLLSSRRMDEHPALERRYASWLEFRLLFHLERKDIAEALDVMTEMDARKLPLSEAACRLKSVLEKKLSGDTHAAAFARLRSGPEIARDIWEKMLRRAPEDLETRHHLACFCWDQAHREAVAGRFEKSLAFWKDGLEHYRRIYAEERFWEGLREKGKALENPGKPFRDEEFNAWRKKALFERLEALLELVEHLLAGGGSQGNENMAARVVGIVRASSVGDDLKQRFSDQFAARRLKLDTVRLPDIENFLGRARIVLRVDGENIEARCLMMRALASHTRRTYEEGDRNIDGHLKRLESARDEAEWLNSRKDQWPERCEKIVNDLVAYYQELGVIYEARGYQYVEKVNKCIGESNEAIRHSNQAAYERLQPMIREYYLTIRSSLESADKVLSNSLALQPANITASEMITRHGPLREQVGGLLANMRL